MGTDRETGDYKETYEKFWKDIVEKDGKLNKDQIMRELHDYSFLMNQASEVYMEVTNGQLSKTNYFADSVIGEYQRCLEKAIEDVLEDYKKELKKSNEYIMENFGQKVPPEFQKVLNEHWQEMLA